MPILNFQLTTETLNPVAIAIQNGDCKGYAQMEHLGEEALCLHHHIVHDALIFSAEYNIYYNEKLHTEMACSVREKKKPDSIANTFTQSPRGICRNNSMTPEIYAWEGLW